MEDSASKKAAHKVFLSSQVSKGQDDPLPNAVITHGAFGVGPRLAEYDLVLLDFTSQSSRKMLWPA